MTRRERRATWLGLCVTCGKRCYVSKRDAKDAARRHTSRTGRLSPYRCGEWWHVGHLPPVVARGHAARPS